jgi:hypothetical protein
LRERFGKAFALGVTLNLAFAEAQSIGRQPAQALAAPRRRLPTAATMAQSSFFSMKSVVHSS